MPQIPNYYNVANNYCPPMLTSSHSAAQIPMAPSPILFEHRSINDIFNLSEDSCSDSEADPNESDSNSGDTPNEVPDALASASSKPPTADADSAAADDDNVSMESSSDEIVDDDDPEIYEKFMQMRKKYRQQRRISKQFEKCITNIQDENEDSLLAHERHLRKEYEKEYELKMIELEHRKLNNQLNHEQTLKQLMQQNQQLMHENEHLRQMSQTMQPLQPLPQYQRSQSLAHVAFTPTSMNRRTSNFSTASLPNLPQYEPLNVACFGQPTPTEPTHRYQSSHSFPGDPEQCPQINDENDDDADDVETVKVLNLRLNLGVDSRNETVAEIEEADDNEHENESLVTYTPHVCCNYSNDGSYINMEPANKYKKRKKIVDLESKMMLNDEEMKKKIGAGLTKWDRFLNFMTPSICSCSPHAVNKTNK
jgi:hypothetical protein